MHRKTPPPVPSASYRPPDGSRARPVILLGGYANALSIVRSLSKQGIEVSVVAESRSPALRSRFCRERHPLPPGAVPQVHWRSLLLEENLDRWRGSVLFPCEDNAIDTVASNYEELRQHYLVAEYDPQLWRAMLDKRRTLELAAEAGCNPPKFLEIHGEEQLRIVADEFLFPVLLKPLHSHLFKAHFDSKLFVVESPAELRARAEEALTHELKMMAVEYIPGPDTQLSSYYTYLTPAGEHLFHFTKRIIRRSPPRVGAGCYHVTEWLPETAEMGKRFFRNIGFTGLGNIEFKTDPRDGKLKVIECNARFTEGQEVMTRSGLDIAALIYHHLTGGPTEESPRYRDFVHYWYPELDFDSFRQLRQEGTLTLWGWLRSIAKRQHFPYFSLTDPVPGAVLIWRSIRTRLGRQLTNRLRPTPAA